MKIGRRRTAESPSPASPGPSDDGGPVAVYARVLDGESLWLAVDGATGPIRLRREGEGALVEPENDAPSDPTYTSLRWHLPTALPGDDAAVFEVVTADGDPLRARPLPDRSPMRTPPSRDGRWQFEVRRREGGALVVERAVRPPTAEVADTVVDDDGLVVTFTDAGLAEPRLLLVDGTEATVAEIEVVRAGDLWSATVHAGVVPTEQGPLWTLVLADGDRRVPLVRPRNDSAMPGHATVLPFLWTGDGDERSMVRFQYQREGRIRVNRPPTGEEDSA